MPLTPALRSQLLDLARLALDLIEAEAREPVEITLHCSGNSIRILYQPAEVDHSPAAQELSPMARALYQVATEQPATPKQMGRRAGYRSLSHIYGCLKELVQAGLLERLPDGTYRRCPADP